MKIIYVVPFLFLAACSSSPEIPVAQDEPVQEAVAEPKQPEQETEAAESSAEDKQTLIAEGRALIKGSDCLTCHHPKLKKTGPAYIEVAKKYKDQEGAVDQLAQKIIKGGNGVWGLAQMKAHPNLSMEDARKMVLAILDLAK